MREYNSIAELKLISSSVLESSLAGFWDWNIETNEEYLSPRFKQMFGYEDHEMQNNPEAWQKIAYPEDLAVLFDKFHQHVESRGEVSFNSVVRFYHKSGETIWVRCNGKVVEWSDRGEPLRAIGCHVDITDEKLREIELEKALGEKEILIKEVHHRVKNNFQLLLSLSRIKSREGKVNLVDIENSIGSIASAYNAVYSSKDVLEINIDLYLKQLIAPLAKMYKIDFSLESVSKKENIDFLVPIGLVLSELVNNSVKHAFQHIDQKKIQIIAKEKESQFVIDYKDNGKGFELSTIRANNLESLGIEIIKSLVGQMDGEVSFYNENGACANIKIPFRT